MYLDGIPNADVDFALGFNDGGAAAAIEAKLHDAADQDDAVIIPPSSAAAAAAAAAYDGAVVGVEQQQSVDGFRLEDDDEGQSFIDSLRRRKGDE